MLMRGVDTTQRVGVATSGRVPVGVAARGHKGAPAAAEAAPVAAPEEGPGRGRGKVTVRYDRRELRKRLHLEEWILAQLTALYDCREEEIPELEIDVDELLDMESDGARSARVQEILVDCYKPTEAFVGDLLEKIRGMQKLNTPQKK
ncbi:PREDICTED: protein phosphatase 1 regulatory subunit 14B [Pseudopodoces humilis]|uniref:protein phosphatase 1 regulatory subunit 14B n=1 Tax=Pseudopodoces humilis TaxID=181119 RepID=UPI0006B7A754|nr:PREDICTED: protein phosphatase 1 regulatory subunit 14B [Pseudopodoces humilis]